MSGQAAGLIVFGVLGAVAGWQTVLGILDRRRDQRRAEDVLRRNGL